MRFARAARKHRIGRSRAEHVMATSVGIAMPALPGGDPRVVWVGTDPRGRELEIIAVLLPDLILVIHVMPYDYRRRGR
jgi:hypothetical protein